MTRGVALKLSLAAAVVVPLLATVPAAAGSPGRWTSISGGSTDLGITMRPSAVRTPDGLLHVVYVRRDGDSSYSIRHVAVGANGTTSRAVAVVSNWANLTRDPEILLTSAGLRVVFSGLRTTTTGDSYTNGGMFHATSDLTGTSWTLQTTHLSDSTLAYASNGTGAVTMSNGSTLVAFPQSSTIRYANSEVADPQTPADDPQFSVAPGSPLDVELARVPGTDEVWASWFSFGNEDEVNGVFVRQLTPSLGPVIRAPRSVTRFDGRLLSDPFSGAPPLAARGDGSVFVAYPIGYPSAKSIGVWRVGADSPAILPQSGDGRYADLSVGTGGRIWAAWSSGHTVRAARSNPAGSRFGSASTLGSIRVDGSPSTWEVQVTAAGGSADVIVNTSRQLVHQRVLARLTLGASPGAWDGDRTQVVTFTVADAGAPVGGATVRADGKRCSTNGQGRCTIRFGTSAPRRFTATATKSGYTGGSRVLTVRR